MLFLWGCVWINYWSIDWLIDWLLYLQEEDNAVFLSTLTRSQAAAVERRVTTLQQTLLRRRNRQHVPDVRDIFRPPEKVWRCAHSNKHKLILFYQHKREQLLFRELEPIFVCVSTMFYRLWHGSICRFSSFCYSILMCHSKMNTIKRFVVAYCKNGCWNEILQAFS